MPADRSHLPPGRVIGILGGGQLGRMIAAAAARLGYRAHIFCQDANDPAAQVAAATLAAFDDRAALQGFAAACDVVTYEFENVPLAAVDVVAGATLLRPGRRALEVAQDRLAEKSFVAAQGIATAAWRAAGSAEELAGACRALGPPVIAKTRRLGYDGKGQLRIDPGDDAADCWSRLPSDPRRGDLIVEALVDFAQEISVIVARDAAGATECYVPVENRHTGGILAETVAPARIAPAVAEAARDIAVRLAAALDIVGLLAVEMFVTRDDRVLVNELAPRPHNSGHWTIDACRVSQFEQLVRAVAGLPLGDPARHSDAVMRNLIGDDVDTWRQLVAEPGACLHLYGKTETKPGRKMGHVTYLKPLSEAEPRR